MQPTISDRIPQQSGYLCNIQRFTVHDGPGIRTELFFKGCPLRCKWCGNPECLKLHPEVGVYSSRCLGIKVCGCCLSVCPAAKDIFSLDAGKVRAIKRDLCTNCLSCTEVCPANALVAWGKNIL
jgi:pyruvate formate lyase activating enzyme